MRKARITGSRTPSRGSLPFSEIRCPGRYAAAYLTTTIRSQGFSPSQRFDPRTSLRLYFTPHPLVGFRPSEPFPPEPAVTPHDAQCSHAIRQAPSSRPSGCANATHRTTNHAQALTSEPCSGLVSDTSHTSGLACKAAALLAFSSPRFTNPLTDPLRIAPHALERRRKPRLPTSLQLLPCVTGYEPTNLRPTPERAKPAFSRF